jgi:hypothetical protein
MLDRAESFGEKVPGVVAGIVGEHRGETRHCVVAKKANGSFEERDAGGGLFVGVDLGVVDLREVATDELAWLVRAGPNPEAVAEALAAVGVGLARRG